MEAAAIPVEAAVEAPVQAAVQTAVQGPVQAPVQALVQAPVQAPVQAAVQAPFGRDPYEEEEYIRPANPYDTSLVDAWSEVDSSDVGTDDESRDIKARQVMRKLQSGKYDAYFANGVYMCPFCKRRLGGTDFHCIVTHAENVSTGNANVGPSVNANGFFAKHKALGIHLRDIQQVAIAEGRMPPIRRRRR